MKIIVCLKEVIDPALSLGSGLRHRVVFREGLPRRLNPADAAALALALGLKSTGGEITLVSIGPERVESYLKNGLALGADRAVRIYAEGPDGLSAYRKAKILSRLVTLYGADIVLTGARSLDTASGLVGPLLAGWLGFACVSYATGLELDAASNSIIATRDIGQGRREKVGVTLPVVVTLKSEARLPYASMDNLIEGQQREVIRLSPADLGLSATELVNEPLTVAGRDYPRPRPVKVPPLDTSLPAFERILQLLQGGVSRRRGLRLAGDADELAEQLFQMLKAEGVLKTRDV
ncbi:MAG: hypothetical protein A2Z29_09765 [Chloroflexi bacterium RBG_16_56_11]|nr:MAG: hypothetical protein A2Z29_09765 [Chloroflexi bacterium RBG_16_56_11]